MDKGRAYMINHFMAYYSKFDGWVSRDMGGNRNEYGTFKKVL